MDQGRTQDTFDVQRISMTESDNTGNTIADTETAFVEAADDVDVQETLSTERGNWSNQLDYVVSMLGCIVGYGNLWRFPYICNRNGGGAFLIPFLLLLVTCGLPLLFLEISIGQFAARSNMQVWDVCPMFKGIGVGQFIACMCSIIYYPTIIAWSIYYLAMSCASVLPWSTCTNDWNTESCLEETLGNVTISRTDGETSNTNSIVNATIGAHFTFVHTDVEEFWQYKVLGVSEGVQDSGQVQWHLALSLVVLWLLVFASLIKGVKSAGKVAYVTVFLPYLLLVVLLIRTLLLPGAVDGIVFYLKPDLTRLLDLQVWLEAMIQLFYSLCPGWGVIITLASYNKFQDNTLRNSAVLTFCGEGTSLISGLVIFTVLGFMANSVGVGVSEVVSSGPGLAFVAYPGGLSQLPLPQLWSFLFFLMMLSVGLDSQFAWMETVITNVIDQFPAVLRKRRILVTAVSCTACFLLGLPFVTNGGIFYFQLADWYTGALCAISFGILECIIFSWIYGSRRFSNDVRLMLGRGTPVFFSIMLAYVTPCLLTIALFLVLWRFQPPSYGDYQYPWVCQVAGWILASMSVIPVPVMAAVTLFKAKGSFMDRLKASCRPADSCTSLKEHWDVYRERPGIRDDDSCLNPCRR
ncbi:sodium- and chloride-dependent glycine transporter 2-like [Haliotis asinina]|uniref:sodium- and chloride-dependent glycine transporter 2-like n=1 Tax=Haliotis asinina TaxID=109174 RepID=UPI0035326FB1